MSNEHKPMTDDELDAIQGRLRNITPPPWFHVLASIVGTKDDPEASDATCVCCTEWGYCGDDPQANAEFIAAAPTDISRLLAEVERLRKEVARLNEEADWLVRILSLYTEDCPLKFSLVYEEKLPIPKIDGCDGAWPDDDYFDCSNSTPEKCWREAARKAVEEEKRHG
ncbi:hypothetical protein [Desulfovibrio piger]|uniref:hypothetical protein n=1 Tax=Desulfovibrio piger TaxID=901 RepID=UPI0039F457BC